MSDRPAERVNWRFSQSAFDRFLAALHADRDIAAERYEQIRSKLLRFFEWRGCLFPEEQADETITRVIRKIDEGDSIRDPGTYCYGVARLVLLEALKHQEKEKEALGRFQHVAANLPDDEDIEGRLACLQACVKKLPIEQQELITEYYRVDTTERIDCRKRLAERLGIGLNALRIRAHRLSERLELCMHECVQHLTV